MFHHLPGLISIPSLFPWFFPWFSPKIQAFPRANSQRVAPSGPRPVSASPARRAPAWLGDISDEAGWPGRANFLEKMVVFITWGFHQFGYMINKPGI